MTRQHNHSSERQQVEEALEIVKEFGQGASLDVGLFIDRIMKDDRSCLDDQDKLWSRLTVGLHPALSIVKRLEGRLKDKESRGKATEFEATTRAQKIMFWEAVNSLVSANPEKSYVGLELQTSFAALSPEDRRDFCSLMGIAHIETEYADVLEGHIRWLAEKCFSEDGEDAGQPEAKASPRNQEDAPQRDSKEAETKDKVCSFTDLPGSELKEDVSVHASAAAAAIELEYAESLLGYMRKLHDKLVDKYKKSTEEERAVLDRLFIPEHVKQEPMCILKLFHPAGDELLLETMDFLWRDEKHRGSPVPNRLYRGNDSILEIPEWYAFCEAPRSVAMQLETHKKKHGCYLWMASARPDRDEEAYKAYSREQPVKFVFKFTARGIIDISHYRMCNKAEKPTREFMMLLKSTLKEQGKEGALVAAQMMPMCAFRNGLCTELNSCRNPKKYEDVSRQG